MTADPTPKRRRDRDRKLAAASDARFLSHPKFDLRFARRDAEAFVESWKSQEGIFYDRVEATVLLDEQATATNVRRGMDWLVKSATQHDLAMLFLASHGVQDPRRNYCLATHELDPEQLRSTAVSHSEIKQMCEELPCKILMFVDTCHGGLLLEPERWITTPGATWWPKKSDRSCLLHPSHAS